MKPPITFALVLFDRMIDSKRYRTVDEEETYALAS